MRPLAGKIVIGALAVGALAAAYWLGLQQAGESTGEVAAIGPAPEEPETPDVHRPSPLPEGHPPSTTADDYQVGRAGTRFAHFKVGNSNVKALLTDGPLLWVGTSGGVIRYDTEKDQHRLFDVRAGLLSNGIFHLSKLGDRLLVGTYGGGLSVYDPASEKWDNYNIQHGLADAFVYDVEQMDNGDIWIATWSGANLVRGGRLSDRSAWTTFTVENTDGGLPNDWVYGLDKGGDGDLWLATEGGLAHFDDGQWTHWTHQDGLGAAYELVRDQIEFQRDPAKESSHHARQKVEMGLQDVDVAYNPNYIVSLYAAPDGTVWCGTWGGGLAHFDGQSWKNFTVADGLPANHVFLLEPTGDGDIWVGTSGGLARFDGQSFKVYTTHDGLFANNVFSLARADDDSLWVGSYGGVAKLKGVN
jgi:ligand-binding sensor domain-containing protein